MKHVFFFSCFFIQIPNIFSQEIINIPYIVSIDSLRLNRLDSLFLPKEDSLRITFATGFYKEKIYLKAASWQFERSFITDESSGLLGSIKVPTLMKDDTIEVVFNNSHERLQFLNTGTHKFIYVELVETKNEKYFHVFFTNRRRRYW